MFRRRFSRPSSLMATSIVLLLGLVSVALGQALPSHAITSEADKTPDEIIVYGQKNVVVLRNELNRAEESFCDLFNSLNSDDEFDVDCKKRQKSITERRKEHRCMPNFALKYAAHASSAFRRDMG